MKTIAVSMTNLYRSVKRKHVTLDEVANLDLLLTGCWRDHIMRQGIPMEVTWEAGMKSRFEHAMRHPRGVPIEDQQLWKAVKKAIQRLDARGKVIYRIGCYPALEDWMFYHWNAGQIKLLPFNAYNWITKARFPIHDDIEGDGNMEAEMAMAKLLGRPNVPLNTWW